MDEYSRRVECAVNLVDNFPETADVHAKLAIAAALADLAFAVRGMPGWTEPGQ